MRCISQTFFAIAVALSLVPSAVSGQPVPVQDTVPVYVLEPMTVEGRRDDLTGEATSASVGYVGYRDFRMRPLLREGELLETVPGMILTQHSGSGKSNQMFVRGFNLDHGTDFSLPLCWVRIIPGTVSRSSPSRRRGRSLKSSYPT